MNTRTQDNNYDIPTSANSVFRFQIKEDVKTILSNIKKGARPQAESFTDIDGMVYHTKKWDLDKAEDGTLFLVDLDFMDAAAVVKSTKTGLMIRTVSDYKYDIVQNSDGGCSVEFDGPVNGLLNQVLLPDMTYVPHTLEGKFVDGETHEDLTPYLDMETYGKLRAQKNAYKNQYGERGNEQDVFGYKINRKFNNELPFLPRHMSGQEYKLMRGQKGYGQRDWESRTYLRLDSHRKQAAGKPEKSGAVVADKIAEDIISGKEKRTITPEVGKEIRNKLTRGR